MSSNVQRAHEYVVSPRCSGNVVGCIVIVSADFVLNHHKDHQSLLDQSSPFKLCADPKLSNILYELLKNIYLNGGPLSWIPASKIDC